MMQFLDPPGQRAADALPVHNSSVEQIDRDAVRRHIDAATARGRCAASDVLEYLERRRCVVRIGRQLVPTLAGLLCFGTNPQATLPQAVVDLGQYRGPEVHAGDLLSLEKNIGGTVFEQIDAVVAYLWQHTRHERALNNASMKYLELDEYPREVVYELAANMLAHRDYLSHSAARVLLLADRIEWISPGGLLPGTTVENLLDAKQLRNPHLMQVLYEAGRVAALGQGLDTVVALMQSEQMPPIEFVDLQTAFLVRVRSRFAQAALRRGAALSGLTAAQRQILLLLESAGALSSQELHARLAGRSRRAVQRDLQVLVEIGLVGASGSPRMLRYSLCDASSQAAPSRM